MFYLWKDARSTPDKLLTYITDYKEFNLLGQVWIDGFGWCKCELLFMHHDKTRVRTFAQTYSQIKWNVKKFDHE